MKAFDKWQNNSYLGKTLHPHRSMILSLMEGSFRAGILHAAEIAEKKGVYLSCSKDCHGIPSDIRKAADLGGK